VTDADTGLPIANAWVQAYWSDGSDWYWTGYAETASDGSHTLLDSNGYGAGDYWFGAEASGYRSQELYTYWDGSGPMMIDFTLWPETSPAIASGAVYDAATWQPVEGAWVLAEWSDGADWYWAGEAYTAPDGSYDLYDDYASGAGDYRFYVEADGYVSQTRYEIWDGMSTLFMDFELEVAQPIASGAVTDAGTGLPIEDAWVGAGWSDGTDWYWAGDAWTDIDGAYTLVDPNGYGAGDYEFRVEAYGYEYQTHTEYWDGTAPLAIDFALEVAQPVATGTVTGADTGLPIADAWVEAYWSDGVDWDWVGYTPTDLDGLYTIVDSYAFGAGDYRFTAWADGYEYQTHDEHWNGAAPLAIDFALELAQPLATGTVTDAGTGLPMSDVWVEAYWSDGVEWHWVGEDYSAADGTYTILDLHAYGAGDYWVGAEAFGYVSQSQYVYWDGSGPMVLDFALWPEMSPAIASGYVFDAATDEPVEGAYVSASWFDGADW